MVWVPGVGAINNATHVLILFPFLSLLGYQDIISTHRWSLSCQCLTVSLHCRSDFIGDRGWGRIEAPGTSQSWPKGDFFKAWSFHSTLRQQTEQTQTSGRKGIGDFQDHSGALNMNLILERVDSLWMNEAVKSISILNHMIKNTKKRQNTENIVFSRSTVVRVKCHLYIWLYAWNTYCENT